MEKVLVSDVQRLLLGKLAWVWWQCALSCSFKPWNNRKSQIIPPPVLEKTKHDYRRTWFRLKKESELKKKRKQYLSNLLDAMARRKQFHFTKIFHVCKYVLKATVLKNLFCKGIGVGKDGKRIWKKKKQYVFVKCFGSQIAYSIKSIWQPPHWNLLLVSESTVKKKE